MSKTGTAAWGAACGDSCRRQEAARVSQTLRVWGGGLGIFVLKFLQEAAGSPNEGLGLQPGELFVGIPAGGRRLPVLARH